MVKSSDVFSIVLDLEATCWETSRTKSLETLTFEPGSNDYKQRYEMEVIEIGAVRVKNFYYEIVDEFQTFVRPVLNPILTDYCNKLTTITQKDVDSAPLFDAAFTDFMSWAKGANLFIGWGNYDYSMLKGHCAEYEIPCFPSSQYLNGKEEYQRLTGRRARGLSKAVSHYKLEFEGVHHRAISDAIMTAKVLASAKKELLKHLKS